MLFRNYSLTVLVPIFLIIGANEAESQKKVNFEEDFDNNSNNWPIKNKLNAKSKIKNDKYKLITNNYGGLSKFGRRLDFPDNRFYISTRLTCLNPSNSSFNGVFWGDDDDIFRFAINTNTKQYEFTRCRDANNISKYDRIIKKTRSRMIRGGKSLNKISVLVYKNKYYFAINGEVIDKAPHRGLSHNKAGFLIGIDQKVEAYNFKAATSRSGKINPDQDPNTEWKGNGTGFFVSKEGHICTNYHVISDANEIEVQFERNNSQKNYTAKVLRADEQNDLAILKITDKSFKNLHQIPYDFQPKTVDVGSKVFTLSYPMALNVMGEDVKFTQGRVSSQTGYKGEISTYQVSVPVQEGSSGSPLFDYKGNLIGINSAKISSDKADNVSYAVKSTYLQSLIEVLPSKVTLPQNNSLSNKNIKEKIKKLDEYVTLIKVK
jgi:S1-C subfamily serine protease